MMRQTSLVVALLVAVLSVASVGAFAPATSSISQRPAAVSAPSTPLYMFGEGEEPKKLTRDNEPDEYFSSNMDKMSDQEKLPIALAGLAFISLPFIAGLIALYAAK